MGFEFNPQKAYQRVWADFNSLDLAFQRAPLRAAFLQLPRGAVEHLICSQVRICVFLCALLVCAHPNLACVFVHKLRWQAAL